MTTKIKIIAGFTCMMLLLLAIAFVGYTSLHRSSVEFQESDRLSSLNIETSDLLAALYMLTGETYYFLDIKDPKHMDNALKGLDTAMQKTELAQKLVRDPGLTEDLARIVRYIRGMREPLDKVRSATTEAARDYEEIMRPATQGMTRDLLVLAKLAADINNGPVSLLISEALSELGPVGNALGRFTENRSKEETDSITEQMKTFQNTLKEIEQHLLMDEGRRAYAQIMNAYDNLNKSFESIKTGFSAVRESLQTVQTSMDGVIGIANSLSANTDTRARETAASLLDTISTGVATMLGVSIGGLILGILITLSIVIGIIRALGKVSEFAGAIAKGDFNYDIKLREKGEIAAIVKAMNNIPVTLQEIADKSHTLADRVSSGYMRDTLTPGEFPGAFAHMAEAVNLVGASYLNILDALTLPIMAADQHNLITFLNNIAQTVLEGNPTRQRCADHLAAGECGTDKCFGYCAMKKNTRYAGETTIHPKGRAMQVSVHAFPLHNLKNEVVGYVEILSDLTALKEQQAAVMKAVNEASEISDRVAAASEELSAQVDEITRGTDMERNRVGSTATAMEEMNATVLEVAKNAGQASEQSDNTRQKAEKGSALVNSVVKSINTVNSVAMNLQNKMQELGQQAEDIGGVMNIISDIADQTNLLALNAAIEAARAGEAGRGFAVVADEVRKLAEKTMHATSEVGSNIGAIQNSAHVSINEVGEAVTSISEATELANSSGQALQEIVDLASSNSAVVASIATAAEQQSATSEEINRSIEEINRIVAETSEGMAQSSEAVQDLSHMAQELRRIMDQLAKSTS